MHSDPGENPLCTFTDELQGSTAITDLHQHAEQIFSEAIDRSGAARTDFLEQSCGDDHELRDEVDALIAHYESTEDVLTAPAGSSHSISTGPDDELNLSLGAQGPVIGSYRVLEVLVDNEPLGISYRVEQHASSQICRLDLYRSTHQDTETTRHFQVLGDQLMRCGSTSILEAGTADTGRGRQPFVVSRHDEQVAVLDHAGQCGLSIDDRIALLERICEAVMALHRTGIIHGDLRPATVVVGSDGQPDLLDPGIARVLSLEHSLAGSGETVQGTDWKAPEHTLGVHTTLGDVHALGHLGAALLEGADTPALQAICDKARAAEPAERYGSPDAMRHDLERARRNEPIDAGPVGFIAECRAVMGRHPLSTACAVLIVLATLLISLLIGANAFNG
ncbi:MAG: protein kinase [Phycisphaerales bacterium]|nr:protein kinase [Phycisphaerales bacterium]